MTFYIYTRDKKHPWTPIARWRTKEGKQNPLRRCVVETDKPIVVRDTAKNSQDRLLLPGRTLIWFTYTLVAKVPDGNKWDCFDAARVQVYHSNLEAILGNARK